MYLFIIFNNLHTIAFDDNHGEPIDVQIYIVQICLYLYILSDHHDMHLPRGSMDFRNDAIVLCRVVDTIKAVFTLRAMSGSERDRAIYRILPRLRNRFLPQCAEERVSRLVSPEGHVSAGRRIPEIFFRKSISEDLATFLAYMKAFLMP